ncbi:MAG: phosphoglycerate kinase [Candidatus Dadabacteria bacterium]|nr:MAG: phosphoglycerate kinase [Candidatus Dadabacteria bacterium]
MAIRSIDEIDIEGRRLLIRVDYNVPIVEGRITDTERIHASLPTIKNALNRNAHIILASHLGRPGGKHVPEMSLKPVARELSSILRRPVMMAPDVIGEDVEKLVELVGPSQLLMLENLRFHPGEEANDREFARTLAGYAHVYVNDAYGVCHRAHASVAAVPSFYLDKGAGFLLLKEIEYLTTRLEDPSRPFVLIFGGAKVDEKIPAIRALLNRATTVIIGGAMAYSFLKAQGHHLGKSLIASDDKVEQCKEILAEAEQAGVEILLPVDHIAAKRLSKSARPIHVDGIDIPDDLLGLDIGPQTIERYCDAIDRARTIVWNGPMGAFEYDPFARGSFAIARAVAANRQTTIVGGGDTISALKGAGATRGISHISTGGGAMLHHLSNKPMPGIEALEA